MARNGIILVTGGARSGKSTYALLRAEALSTKRLFVATSPKVDPEMSERIRRHQVEREGRGWTTIEAETDLASIFTKEASDFEVVLIDCITLWVNNILYSNENLGKQIDDHSMNEICRQWLDAAKQFTGRVICVTNEVGLGIVPENALARKYRDLVGTCNQLIGKNASEVVLVSCGIPLILKN